MSWSQAWRRALLVWVKGLCLGLPWVFLITSAIAMRRVTKTGRASWDQATRTNVVRLRASSWNVFLRLVILFHLPVLVAHLPGVGLLALLPLVLWVNIPAIPLQSLGLRIPIPETWARPQSAL